MIMKNIPVSFLFFIILFSNSRISDSTILRIYRGLAKNMKSVCSLYEFQGSVGDIRKIDGSTSYFDNRGTEFSLVADLMVE